MSASTKERVEGVRLSLGREEFRRKVVAIGSEVGGYWAHGRGSGMSRRVELGSFFFHSGGLRDDWGKSRRVG